MVYDMDKRVKQKIIQNGLLVGLLGLIQSSICVTFGFAIANVSIPWYGDNSQGLVNHITKIIFGLPISYLIIPAITSYIILLIFNAKKN